MEERILELERQVAILINALGGERKVQTLANRNAPKPRPEFVKPRCYILTLAQANFIKSRTNKIVPRELNDGKFAVSERVAEDAQHAALREALIALPLRYVEENEWKMVEE